MLLARLLFFFVERMAKKQATSESNPQKFAAMFADDAKWQHVKGVPVFDDHVENYSVAGADGRPVAYSEHFDTARLQKIADNCNRLVQSGNPIGLTVGHTADAGTELQQPETIGYACNYRVDTHPVLGRPCIFHDEKFYPDKYEIAKGLPYRSVERWKPNAADGGDYFKPVALLRREPRRQLGPVAYMRGASMIVRYSMEQYAMTDAPPKEPEGDETPPEASAPAAPPAPAPPAAAAPMAPPAAPAAPAAGPSDQDKEIFKALCAMYGLQCGAGPAAPGAPGAAPPPPMQNAMGGAPAGGMGMPSGSNTLPPGSQVPKMSADTSEVERYAAQVQSMSARIAELEKGERIARYAAKFDRMAELDGYPIDASEETVRCQDYSQAQFEQHVKDIEKYAANSRLPIGPGASPSAAPHPMQALHGGRLDEAQFEKAMQYMRENPGKGHTEAIKYAMNGSPVR